MKNHDHLNDCTVSNIHSLMMYIHLHAGFAKSLQFAIKPLLCYTRQLVFAEAKKKFNYKCI